MLSNNRTSTIERTQRGSIHTHQDSLTGVVYHVILDYTDPILKDYGVEDEDRALYVGSVIFRLESEINRPDTDLSFAFPKNINISRVPVKNEQINITKSPSGGFFYETVAKLQFVNITSSDDVIKESTKLEEDNRHKTGNYDKVRKTGITRSSVSERSEYDNFGEYFKFQRSIHKLKLYEGDTLIQSRFGQSIRFSGYNNSQKSFSPTIIIRNSENAISQSKGEGEVIEEDINRDGSIVVLGSGDYLLPFQPGHVDDKGKSDFKTTPSSFRNYPNRLIGNQLLLNSDRIILSSKTGEMIFYSKKNYGFISDGGMSIDNRLGIDIMVGDDINVDTNNSDVNINTDNGKINLGNRDLEPIVKGDVLVDLLGQLIDEISNQVFLTPSGPTATGPTNRPKIMTIKSKLTTALSKLNKTS